ncbi:multi antimicrobial extrusion protein MatE [Evansella sp. AB-P1]|uniref:multi antimicrobial extrusion protein MatE n=1 Tax=Evansella sp. AB-P1 TaxID=3037653 RepID=UPI00242047CA|nr:multi antimicrobial extrusion protein MatE [Evansella sp. AB-P1]MDG5788452.1 multi antimicrobial extrusion protein MatE [Evansella sp. AB-P1]
MINEEDEQIRIKTLLFFFIPLGISASLVTTSHVIINSTLGRAENAEFLIASYAIAMSIFVFTEKTAVLLRQSCSALVKDKISFSQMYAVTMYVILFLFIFSALIAFTPIGTWLIGTTFGIDQEMAFQVKHTYQVLLFVTIFSALRCLYQGIIISNRRTKWITIGMGVRLTLMYLLSLYFISFGTITGRTGAIIFLAGMFIECCVSVWEGRHVVRSLPEEYEKHHIRKKKQIFTFYSPLVLSSLFTVLIGPSINVFLGKTSMIELSIASYAVALSITQLVSSFFSYTHQIVLNFFNIDAKKVVKFSFVMGLFPSILLTIFTYTIIGPWFLEHAMGLNDRLIEATLQALRVFVIFTLVFPYLDFCNGLLMLKSQTRFMVFSQMTNLAVTLIVLFISVSYFSYWNGAIGALAQSVGVFSELCVIIGFFMYNKMFKINKKQLKKKKVLLDE